MFDRFNNLLGYGANSDLLITSTDPQAYLYGQDLPRAQRGNSRDGQHAPQNLPPHNVNPGQTQNERETSMVPHTRRAFAQHKHIEPYHRPSIRASDMKPQEGALPPLPTQPTNHAPQLNCNDPWNVIFGKDQIPELQRSLSSRDRILTTTQRRPSVSQQDKQARQRDLSPVDKLNEVACKILQDSPARNFSAPPVRNLQACQTQQPVRETRGPPIAYKTHAMHVERVVDSARDISPYLTRFNCVTESRSVVDVDPLIQSLRDRPWPFRSGSLDETRRNGSISSRDRYQPLPREGRKMSSDEPDGPNTYRQGSRKVSFN